MSLPVSACSPAPTKNGVRTEQVLSLIKFGLVAAGLIVSMAMYVARADATASERLSVLEARYGAVCDRLEGIESGMGEMRQDIKALLRRPSGERVTR